MSQRNHEIIVTCPHCGEEFDIRKDWPTCPYCGHDFNENNPKKSSHYD